MNTPDLEAIEANRRTAALVLEATKLLVAYLDACPSPPRRLTDRLVDSLSDLPSVDARSGAFPEAAEVAFHLSTWIAKCVRAVEYPWSPEDEES